MIDSGKYGKVLCPRGGFTLLELLIVIVVIGILMGLLSTALVKAKERSRDAQARAELKTLAAGLRAYRHEYGRWPFRHPGDTSGKNVFQDDCAEVIKCMRDSAKECNPRQIQFMNWNEYFTLNRENERVPIVDYMEANSSRPIPLVDPWGNKLIITIDVNLDRAIVESLKLKRKQDA